MVAPFDRLPRLNLNTLRVAEAAARHGSFTRAAEENLVTPSAVSQQIRKLEDQLGFRIFQRRGNFIALTADGEEFVDEVRGALDRIAQAQRRGLARPAKDVIKLSALPTFTLRWLQPRLAAFCARAEVQVEISNSYTCVDFEADDFDCAIRYGQGEWPGLTSEVLLPEDLVPVVAPDLWHAVQGHSAGSPDPDPELLAHFTLLHSATCTDFWQRYLDHVGAPSVLTPSRQATLASCPEAAEAAAAGRGIALINRFYVESELRDGRLIAPFPSSFRTRFQWYFVRPRDCPASPAVIRFADWLRREARSTRDRPVPTAAQ
jgi:LysR family glycine cleavage system transcriptional activator